MRARQTAAFVGETVGLLLLLLRRLLLWRPCLISELTGRVARIGPCFEHGEDFRIRCELDIFSSLSRNDSSVDDDGDGDGESRIRTRGPNQTRTWRLPPWLAAALSLRARELLESRAQPTTTTDCFRDAWRPNVEAPALNATTKRMIFCATIGGIPER